MSNLLALEGTPSVRGIVYYEPDAYEDVDAANDDVLVPAIHDLMTKAGTAAYTAIAHAIRVGHLLTVKKADLQHGLFTAWVDKKLGVSSKTASVYMRAYAAVEADPKVDLRDLTVLKLAAKAPSQRTKADPKKKPTKTKKVEQDDADERDDERDDDDGDADLVATLRKQIADDAAEIQRLEREVRKLKSEGGSIPSEDLDVLVEAVVSGTGKVTALDILRKLGAKVMTGADIALAFAKPAAPKPTAGWPFPTGKVEPEEKLMTADEIAAKAAEIKAARLAKAKAAREAKRAAAEAAKKPAVKKPAAKKPAPKKTPAAPGDAALRAKAKKANLPGKVAASRASKAMATINPEGLKHAMREFGAGEQA